MASGLGGTLTHFKRHPCYHINHLYYFVRCWHWYGHSLGVVSHLEIAIPEVLPVARAVVSGKIIHNKQTRQSEGYDFLDFSSQVAAERAIQNYNGIHMLSTEQFDRLNCWLNWATVGIGSKRPQMGPDYPILVGDFACNVTDYLLQETFRSR